jgi:predicted Zn-dependent protease with MMP-like domain
MATRREQFDDLVLDAAARLEPHLGEHGPEVEFAVEDVPPTDPAPWESSAVPLGRLFPARGRVPARIVVYRRPVESRAQDARELTEIVQDVVVEQVAALLGVAPADLDPRYGDEGLD